MKIIYKGAYNGDPSTLPHREHMPQAVKFIEFENLKQLNIHTTIIGFILFFILCIIYYLLTGKYALNLIGIALSIPLVILRILLQIIFLKEDVYFYTSSKLWAAFFIWTESMSKIRFIVMSLLPNILFGFIPYFIFLFHPQCTILGSLGLLHIVFGIADYYNAYHAFTQMPRKSRTYIYQFNSYWYIPTQKSDIKK